MGDTRWRINVSQLAVTFVEARIEDDPSIC